MEKLQKALSKARQSRGSSAADQPSAARKPAAPRTPERAAAPTAKSFPPIWEQLTPFEPDPDRFLANRIMTLHAQPEANPFDVLRTKVFLLMRQNGWTRLAITSPNKSCGKTTTACNLAVGFSRQREVKSMLLDMDLRRPGIAAMMGYAPEHDIIKLLTGEVAPQEQMVRLQTNLAISMAKRSVNDPTQTLLSQKTVSTLDSLQEQFEPDVMILDLPPMLVTDDTRAVLKNVDCALIVAGAEHTRMSQLDVCEREVSEHTNVLGTVLNNCRHVTEEESYYGDYS